MKRKETTIDMSNQKRFFAIFSSLFILTLYLNTGCHKTMEPEVHILPDGYIGKVYVLFEVKGFEKLKYKNKRRTYNIPDNGILITSSSKNTGFIDAKSHLNFRYKSKNEFINKFIVFDSLNHPVDSSAITVFEYGYGRKRDFELRYPLLSYTVDSFSNVSKKDTYLLRESVLKSEYPELDI